MIDSILLNGDVLDFHAVSRWETDPEERDLKNELELGEQFLSHLRERYPNARIFYKMGNHEERWMRYLRTKAPELCGIRKFKIPAILSFRKYRIRQVGGRQRVKAGPHLTIIHGHEIFGATAPVNFARTLQTKLGVCAVAGHRHQTRSIPLRMRMIFIHCWSVGCLCNMAPDYSPINNWNHGFAWLDLKGTSFEMHNLRIIDGRVVA